MRQTLALRMQCTDKCNRMFHSSRFPDFFESLRFLCSFDPRQSIDPLGVIKKSPVESEKNRYAWWRSVVEQCLMQESSGTELEVKVQVRSEVKAETEVEVETQEGEQKKKARRRTRSATAQAIR